MNHEESKAKQKKKIEKRFAVGKEEKNKCGIDNFKRNVYLSFLTSHTYRRIAKLVTFTLLYVLLFIENINIWSKSECRTLQFVRLKHRTLHEKVMKMFFD